MINFTFNGNNFNSVAGANGFVLNRVGFIMPERDATEVKIPGRNGVLTIDNERWSPVSGYYQCFIQSGYAEKRNLLVNWLASVGYIRLEDTVEPTVYRMAKFVSFDEKKVLYNDIARFDLSFSFQPEKWLKSGETAITVASTATVTNPTSQSANPRIRVNGSGDFTLTVNGETISFTDNVSGITIDSESRRAYNGNTPKDSSMTGDFPILVPGDNSISWTGSGITSVKLTPRWWTL